MKKISLLIIFIFIFSISLFSQIVNVPPISGYPVVYTGWTLFGGAAGAAAVDSEIEITQAAANEFGRVYTTATYSLTACGQFSVNFDFQIKQTAGVTIADGFTFFFLQSSVTAPEAAGYLGSGLNVPGNPNGLTLIFDTYDDDGWADAPAIALYDYNGSVPGYVEESATQRLTYLYNQNFVTNGAWHHCLMTYDAGAIKVYFDYSATALLSTTYVINYAGQFGFSASCGADYSTQSVKNVLIHINSVSPILGNTTVCVGNTGSLSDSTAAGTWTSSNTTVASIGATTGIISGISPGTTTIEYATSAGCDATTIVTVVGTSAITGTESVCQGGTTNLYDASGGGVWSSSNVAIASIVPATGVVSGISSGTATITYTLGAGCITTGIVTVNPVSPITGTLGVCQDLTTALADVIPGGTWSSSNAAVATINTSGIINGLTAGTTTITYTSPASCVMTATATVYPKPAAPEVVSPKTYCQYNDPTAAPDQLTATPTGTDVLNWYGAGVIPEGTTVAPTPTTNTSGLTDFYVTQTSSFGCVSDSATIAIIVTAQPAPPSATPKGYCQYSATLPLNYQVDSIAGSHLTWYTGESGIVPTGIIDSIPIPPNTSVTYPTGTTWYVTQTVGLCTSPPAAVTVNIVYKPKFEIGVTPNWVCDHDTLIFAYSDGFAGLLDPSYLWQIPQGATVVSGSDTSSEISLRFDTVPGPHFIYLTVGELNNMCSTTNTTQVSVISLPSATSYMNTNICLGDTVSLALSNESSDASIFSWYIDGSALASSNKVNIVAANSNSGGPFSLSWNDTGSHIITVVASTEQGCKSTPTNDTIDVHALPNATFTFIPKSTSTLCLEDSVEFIANYVNYACSYLWLPVHGFQNDNKPVIWGKVEETQSDITLTVTDPFGCVGTSTQQLDPSACCSVMFPNAFTPNGDGKDDVFRPLFNGYHNFHSFRIVNRWGQTVFESANSLPAWDGNFNGVAQDIGTYYYYIQYDCGGNTIQAKGDVTLIR